MVPLISASSRSSSSTCSSSQISSYGGMNVAYYGSPYVDYEAAFGLSPSFRRIGGGQSSSKRRLRRLEERIALGINLDENGIPFDRELTEEQRERLFEFRAFKKELQRGEPFVENAEALGLFLEYEEEKNVLLLGCGTSSSSSSSSLSRCLFFLDELCFLDELDGTRGDSAAFIFSSVLSEEIFFIVSRKKADINSSFFSSAVVVEMCKT